MKIVNTFVLALGLALVGWSTVNAQTGREIAQRSQKILFGYNTMTSQARMVLTRGNRVTGERTLGIQLLEQPSGSYDYGLVTIEAPTSLRGTKLLSWSRDDGDDQQWLSTPRSGNTRRIGDRGRKAAFVNSNFSFEDLLKWQLDAYSYEAKGSVACPAGTCQRVNATPAKRTSNYGLLVVDYDNLYRISRIQYFRKGGSQPWKEQVVDSYTKVAGTWQPVKTAMTDFEAGEQTSITWSGYRGNAVLSPSLFSADAL